MLKMRKAIKSPVTDRALKGILNKLDELASDDKNKIGILEQSIINSWKGVFPLKQDKFSNSDSNSVNKNNNNIQVKTRFHNINETFRNYSPDELEKLLKASQEGKF